MVGYDLCTDYSQISYYNKRKMNRILLNWTDRRKSLPCSAGCLPVTNGWWGQQAVKAAQEGKGVPVRNFTTHISDDPMVDVAGERMEKSGLISIFSTKTLKAIENVSVGGNRLL